MWGLPGLRFWGWVRLLVERVALGMIMLLMVGMGRCDRLPVWIICWRMMSLLGEVGGS
jgi:hypothetical protein